jgi:hypothetical protein
MHFSNERNEPERLMKIDRLCKMRTVFEKLNDAYAKYYSPTEHLAVHEVIVLFKGSHFQTKYTIKTQTLWVRNLQTVIPWDIHTT